MKVTILGQLLIDRGLASWMPDFQRAPTPRYAASVLGIDPDVAAKIDKLEFDGNVLSAKWELEQWTRAVK